jgi:hypothetical protein
LNEFLINFINVFDELSNFIPMATKEQRNYFDILKRYERKFESKELDDYKMLVKRHKDDEDLDKLSMQRLQKLYEKYHVNRDKKNYNNFFTKPADNETEDLSSQPE